MRGGLLMTVGCAWLLLSVEGRNYRAGREEVEEEPDQADLAKRQFNEYGHMRFGKRGGVTDDKFEDYGYMRFGRGQP